ncbi:hypothetical protein [Streptomyces sp. NPDC017202]|uniref:hypothetical protein n=1 Tax=Streptomyces sp. NPDC017202 TaxID=3364981 RepID=UPI0037A65741
MENWLDDTQPKEADGAFATDDSVFGGRGTGTRTRKARALSFWETGDEPESARTEATATLPAGAALFPDLTDAGTAGAVDDPHEPTVQLAEISPASRDGGPESQDGAGRPVFVDESGRRSRRLRRLGAAVGITCSVYALVIVATLVSGNSSAPWLPLPGQADDTPAEQVETSSEPSATASPSGSAGAAPSAGPSGSAASTAATAGATDTSGASTGPGRPAVSAPPEASTGTTTRNPAATATASSPTTPASSASASPSAPEPETSRPDSGGAPSPTPDDGTGTGIDIGDMGVLSSAP